jgi:2,3-bisphosphoglycerate-dependent phosphoglycerate mutase
MFLFSSCSTSTYYIVRHAEKRLNEGDNPALTQQGMKRAEDLNTYFGNNKPNKIFVSTFLRTQLTAAPTATAAALSPVIIKQNNTDSLNFFILGLSLLDRKKVLVVSHTDAIPKIVKGLCNVDINPITENDYDNLYIIRLRKNKRVQQFTATTYGEVSP